MTEPVPSPDEAIWRRLAETALGGPLDRLDVRTFEGLAIAPLHARAATEAAQPWRAERSWSVAQRVDHPDAEAANALALHDLGGGADALTLVDRASPYARGFGCDLATIDLDRLFADIDLDVIALRLDAGPAPRDALAAFAEIVIARRLTSAALRLDIGFDPIGCGARLGDIRPFDARPLADLRARTGLAGTLYLADGRPWHEAGAGEAEELAAVLATGVAYLRAQQDEGVPLAEARDAIALLLAVDADVFLGLAKCRAMRRLWARAGEACDLPPAPVRLHAESSWRMMERGDPWTNVMRTVAATFAAGLGGADVVGVMPFTLPLGLPDEPARRLARNVQRVLLDEAHLARVDDPAAGSGAFEALTGALCEKAWSLFQGIETEGGIARAASGGPWRARIAATAAARAEAVATLRSVAGGESLYAAPDRPPFDVLDVAPRRPRPLGPAALPVLRDAEPYEEMARSCLLPLAEEGGAAKP